MLYLEFYNNKLSESGRRLIRKAYDEARNRDHNEISTQHVFASFAEIERPLFNKVMQSLNLDTQTVLQALETNLAERHAFGRGIQMSESFRTLLRNAYHYSRECRRLRIRSTDLFIAIFKDEKSYPVELLKRLSADHEMVMQKIQSLIHNKVDQQ